MRGSRLPGMNNFGQGEQNSRLIILTIRLINTKALKRHTVYGSGAVKPTVTMLTYRSIMVTCETL